jgi:DNA-binding Lrp family transcriptional regulator
MGKGSKLGDRVRIDETDARILSTLLVESRTSLTEIGKNCRITPSAVRMRILRLKRRGIIKGEIMLVNPHSLGYKCIANLGITTAVENESEVTEFLKSKLYRAVGFGFLPKYNVFAVVALNNMQELATIIEDLETNPKVKRVETMIWAEAVHMEHFENLAFEPVRKNVEKVSFKAPKAMSIEEAQIDDIDRQIARILSPNARIPFNRIADQLGISTKNVIQRYRKLKGTVLTHATINVDLRKLGYCAFAFMFIKVANRGKMPEIYSKLLQIPNMAVAVRLLGHYDLNVDLFVRDFEELFEATEQIRRIPGIELTDTYLTPAWPEWPPNLFSSLL